jgi:hypothetical protein
VLVSQVSQRARFVALRARHQRRPRGPSRRPRTRKRTHRYPRHGLLLNAGTAHAGPGWRTHQPRGSVTVPLSSILRRITHAARCSRPALMGSSMWHQEPPPQFTLDHRGARAPPGAVPPHPSRYPGQVRSVIVLGRNPGPWESQGSLGYPQVSSYLNLATLEYSTQRSGRTTQMDISMCHVSNYMKSVP